MVRLKPNVKAHQVALGLFSVVLSACSAWPGRSVIPLPPSPGTASVPAAPGLLVRLDLEGQGGVLVQHVADYLSDGTVIRLSGDPLVRLQGADPPRTLESNKLTAAGLAAMHALLAADADLLGQPRDFTPLSSGGGTEAFVLARSDGSRYAVTVPGVTSPDTSASAAAPGIARLSALAEVLADPTGLVGPAGLASAVWTTYQPALAALFIRSEAVTPAPEASYDGFDLSPMDAARWPFAGAPGTFGTTFTGQHGPEQCTFLPTADAMAAITSLRDGPGPSLAASEVGAGQDTGPWGALWGADTVTAIFSLEMAALLPEDAGVTCLEAYSY